MFFRMIVNQSRYRWQVTILLWLAMTALVSLYVYVANSAGFSNRSMELIMKNMGQNVLVLPKDVDPLDTYLCTAEQKDFPEEVAGQIAKRKELDFRYTVAVLQEKITLEGKPFILTGIEPVHQAWETAEKKHLTEAVPAGQARLGERAAGVLGLSSGETLEIPSQSLTIAGVLEPQGTLDDHRIYVDLKTAQAALGKPGRINAVWTFLCMHRGPLPEVLRYQNAAMGRLFPDMTMIVNTSVARGRDLARRSTSGYLYYLLVLVLGITVVIIGVTGLQEVSERRREIGILLAMGTRYSYIAALYVVKLLAIALVASVTGFLVGSCLSQQLLSPMLVTETQSVGVVWSQLMHVVLLSCLVAVVAALLPIVKLVRIDPNAILTEE